MISKTEYVSKRYHGIDTWPLSDLAYAFWESQMSATACVSEALPAIESAVHAMSVTLAQTNSRFVYVGAGASGLLAMQDAMELTPTFGWPLERIVFLMAGGDAARLLPINKSEDDSHAGKLDIESSNVGPEDVVIAVTASGHTPYTVMALKTAKARGATTIGIANNAGTPLLDQAEHPILLDSGPEVIAGSTRLGAGTAQKAALGMLSSMSMIALGNVMDGMMINVAADNEKLIGRAARIVSHIANCSLEDGKDALMKTNGHVKVAVLVAQGCDKQSAEQLLTENAGNLRRAMWAL